MQLFPTGIIKFQRLNQSFLRPQNDNVLSSDKPIKQENICKSPVAKKQSSNRTRRIICRRCRESRMLFRDRKCYDCYLDDATDQAVGLLADNIVSTVSHISNSTNEIEVITLDFD